MLKLGLAFLCSVTIFVVMMKIQKRREDDAEKKFNDTLRSLGMNPDVEEE